MKLFSCIVGCLFLCMSNSLFSQSEADELREFNDKRQAEIILSDKDAVQAPNTNVFLVPPKNFEVYPETNGFIHRGSSTTIQIIELENVSTEVLIKKLTVEYFSSQGYTLENSETLLLNNGNTAYLYTVSFSIEGEAYERIMFFTDASPGIWININYPSIVRALLYKPIIESLKTVRK